jgi:hypothetical protein
LGSLGLRLQVFNTLDQQLPECGSRQMLIPSSALSRER